MLKKEIRSFIVEARGQNNQVWSLNPEVLGYKDRN